MPAERIILAREFRKLPWGRARGLSASLAGPGKEVKNTDLLRVNGTQLAGVALGILVVAAGIAVNMRKYGTSIPLTNLTLYAALGLLVVLSMFILSRD